MTRLLLALFLIAGSVVGAQPPRGGPVRQTPPRQDAGRRDTVQVDSGATRSLIEWIEMDSVMASLLTRPGYSVTRYQGARVSFDARQRTLYLEGDPAGVGRGVVLLVGDTITYNDSTKIVLARGDTLVLRDPERGAADVVALGQMTYNVELRRGSVTNISTALESGERWYVEGRRAAFVGDTTGGRPTRFYVHTGSITSCDDPNPHYHFQAGQIKLISRNLLVARPAILYIRDVPVFWLPFIFQDMRSGRRSGILTPRFGVNEIVRNSSAYRRHVDNIGYYFAMSDYMDAQVSLDWRSGAASSGNDPGWVRLNGEWRYRWLDRFMTGRVGVSRLSQRDGQRNTAVSWGHQQDFSQTSHLTADINYVTSTALQRRNTFDPRQALATIQSRIAYQQQLGPASFSIGGSRRQYPGREEVTQEFPNFTVSTPTLALARWLDWTPSLEVRNSEQLKVDRTGEFAWGYRTVGGVLDSTRLTSDARVTTLGFNTPLKIFGFTLSNTVRVADQENDAPVRIGIVDQDNPSVITERIFARTFSTEIDFQTSFGLPQFLPTTLKLSPSIGIQNVDPRGYWVRTEQTGGRWVHQAKRLSYSLSSAPTVFGLFPGIGPISRFRHSLSPQITYSYAPAATVPREYLAALNVNPATYLGSLAANQVTLQLSQVLEGKLRSADTAGREARKIKLLGIGFTPLTYDFERRRATGNSGFTSDAFGAEFNSDLLPGFRMGMQYSLFQGSVLSDTSKFKPFRTSVDASFNINSSSGIFGALNRIFGRAIPQATPQVERLERSADDALEQRVASTPVAGGATRTSQFGMPRTQGWQASFTFSSTRQRPPVGGQVVDFDPTAPCEPFRAQGLILQYELCVEQQQQNPVGAVPVGRLTAGGPFIRQPSRENLASQMSFHITPKWAASWGTTYDFRERSFAAHSVTLQRELHDWRAIFAFTRTPTGNFSFNFFIALNAQPDIKFDFREQTYRETTTAR